MPAEVALTCFRKIRGGSAACGASCFAEGSHVRGAESGAAVCGAWSASCAGSSDAGGSAV